MNPQILMVIDNQLNPDKYTQEQLDKNTDDAYDAAAAAAAYVAGDQTDAYWIDRYFEHTGENKQDYIDAVNKGNKQ